MAKLLVVSVCLNIFLMVLIVDYALDNQISLQKLIESWGYLTDIVYTDNEIYNSASKKRYGLIIVNTKGLVENSFHLVKTLNSFNNINSVPILFLSETNISNEDINQLFMVGTIDYLLKPIHPNSLFLRIKLLYRFFEQGLEVRRADQKLQQEVISRRHAQIELRDRIQYLHSILERLPQLIFKADSNGTITFVNNKWFEYSHSALVFPEQDPSMESIQRKFRECRYKNEALEYEVRIKHLKTNTYVYHLLRITPVYENTNLKKWIGTFTDIEEQKQIEHKKEEFLSIASHELKTPLTSIKGYIQLLDRMTSTLDSIGISDIVKKTHNQVLSLEMLISDLLDFTKINNSKFNVNFELFDLEKLITDIIFTFNKVNNHLGICINREGSEISSLVYGDIYKIEQVLVNYLTNAIKYAPSSEKIIVKTTYEGQHIKVSVIDFGVGISKEKQTKLFTKFYRVEDNTISIQGLGIGLYICSEIIKQHNGQYGLESTLGIGSQFYFTLAVGN